MENCGYVKVKNTGLNDEDFLKVCEVIKLIDKYCVYDEKKLVIPGVALKEPIFSPQFGCMTNRGRWYVGEIRFRLERYFSDHIFKHVEIIISE